MIELEGFARANVSDDEKMKSVFFDQEKFIKDMEEHGQE